MNQRIASPEESTALHRSWWTRVCGHVRAARWNLQEASGALGDLGTFLPLVVGLAAQNQLDFATALFFAGLFNILTGCLFRIPMAVQPMKAIAAVALAEGLSPEQIGAAGAIVSLVVLFLGLTGWIGALHRYVPISVVRGLQVALGLTLAARGCELWRTSEGWWAADGYLSGAAALAFAWMTAGSRRVPTALLIFLAGVGIVFWLAPDSLALLRWQCFWPHWQPPAWQDAWLALPKAALPQIPLTTLNSVIAVSALATQLFPTEATTPRRVATSVGLMNLIGCGFGAMPLCHGAGGLAGQYHFGARTHGSILMLGAVKLILAIGFGSTLMAVCSAFPQSLLGVMLLLAGLELTLAGAKEGLAEPHAKIVWLTAVVCLGFQQIALGFLVGCLAAWWTTLHRSPLSTATVDNTTDSVKKS